MERRVVEHERVRRGWWAWHEYPKRRSVEDIVDFCGWNVIRKIVNACELQRYDSWRIKGRNLEFVIMRDKALVVTAFLTGGRIKEVLELKASNFDFLTNEDYIVCSGMLLEKSYTVENLREPVFITLEEYANMSYNNRRVFHLESVEGDEVYVKRHITKRNAAQSIRNDFPIFKSDPFVGLLDAWAMQHDNDEYLFRSSDMRREGKPITSTRAYQIIMNVGRLCNINAIHPHWFRAQRASQLFKEWNLSWEELKLWFGWKTDVMAQRYARVSVDELALRMLNKRSLLAARAR